MRELVCTGCGYILSLNNDQDSAVCPYCSMVNSAEQLAFGEDKTNRLKLAGEFRRMGKFDEAQREFDSLLDAEADFVDALFGCVLNYYEVTEYRFKGQTVDACICESTDKRPVMRNPDAARIFSLEKNPTRREQFSALFDVIEKMRLRNIEIKESIPLYRAILTYDYEEGENTENSVDIADVAHKLYDALSKKTDIFFPPVTLGKIALAERDIYLKQIIKSPTKAPMMFVVYSDSFNFRKKQPLYYKNIARQCSDFGAVHDKTELVSVMSDYEPPHMLKQFSIKTIRSKSAFADEKAISSVSEKIYDMIIDGTYRGDEFDRALDGEFIMLNPELGFSPIIK